jgi:hypothetical protein
MKKTSKKYVKYVCLECLHYEVCRLRSEIDGFGEALEEKYFLKDINSIRGSIIDLTLEVCKKKNFFEALVERG